MRRGHLAHGDWRCLLRDPWASRRFPVFGIEILHFPISSIISISELSPSFFLFICATTPTLLRLPFSVCITYFEGTLFFSSLCFLFFIICLQISDLFLFLFPCLFCCCLFYWFLGFKPFPHLFLLVFHG